MKPITFQCQKHIPHTGEEICNAIANVDAWSQFGGYESYPASKVPPTTNAPITWLARAFVYATPTAQAMSKKFTAGFRGRRWR